MQIQTAKIFNFVWWNKKKLRGVLWPNQSTGGDIISFATNNGCEKQRECFSLCWVATTLIRERLEHRRHAVWYNLYRFAICIWLSGMPTRRVQNYVGIEEESANLHRLNRRCITSLLVHLLGTYIEVGGCKGGRSDTWQVGGGNLRRWADTPLRHQHREW